MVHCVAYGCNQKSDDGTKGFFLFPKDHVYRKKWIEAVGSNRERIGKLYRLYQLHHPACAYGILRTVVFLHPPSVMTVVPTIFPETVEYKKKTLPSPEKFGPPKSHRKLSGAYEKKDINRCNINSLLRKHEK
ncbi:hypothetical protein ACJMK2_024872 [Sinanodonta woodiana]|uniref:THAP-type domain-containing protein n=1 Tax=Sinanodonta woodiana TaxID=1069815 RepID=A0ABD3XIG9_SINWO